MFVFTCRENRSRSFALLKIMHTLFDQGLYCSTRTKKNENTDPVVLSNCRFCNKLNKKEQVGNNKYLSEVMDLI